MSQQGGQGRGERRALLIAGPTASGKSALALQRAEAGGGVIVNADALQVYDVLRVLTARPDEAALLRADHRLYGIVSPAVRFSTGAWLAAVRALVDDEALRGRELIFVGGTGLYFEALTKGIAEVPPVPAEVVAAIEAVVAPLDGAARTRLLVERDPATAARLPVADRQRTVRALAVLEATGRTLSSFLDTTGGGVLGDFAVERLVVEPGPSATRERIAMRFAQMLEQGAVAEVEALRGLGLDPSLPAMKAIGVREIGDWLDGRLSREDAIARAVIATAQYAKRQRTWLRNRMGDWPRLAGD